MCFSAVASFGSAGVLSTAGVFTARKNSETSHSLFALIPLFFGIQQMFEGFVWLTPSTSPLHPVAAYCFVFFSNIVWPVWIPFSAYLMETVAWRKKVLAAFLAIGITVSAYLLYFLIAQPLHTEIINKSIAYICPEFGAEPLPLYEYSLYFAATCVSCMFSSFRYVRLFGIFAFVSAVLTHYFWAATFVSVWCFFAAFLSVFVLAHVCSRSRTS